MPIGCRCRSSPSDVDAQLVVDATVEVDDAARSVRLRDAGKRSFDALLVAPGARAVIGVEGATTWWPGGDPDTYGGLLQDIDEGYSKRIVIAVPPGAVWPLPAYELALMTAGQATAMGHDDVSVTVVTPERRALSLFGDEASAAVADELRAAGVELRTGVVARRDKDGLVLEPGGVRVAAQRVYAVPRLLGPAIDGLPVDEEGFILAGDDARVERMRAHLGRGGRGRLPRQVRRPRNASGASRCRSDRADGGSGGRSRPRRARSSTAGCWSAAACAA